MFFQLLHDQAMHVYHLSHYLEDIIIYSRATTPISIAKYRSLPFLSLLLIHFYVNEVCDIALYAMIRPFFNAHVINHDT